MCATSPIFLKESRPVAKPFDLENDFVNFLCLFYITE